MNDRQQLKREFQHLKKQVKKHSSLFARLASLEMEQGKYKAARKRLAKGLERFPEMASAKTLLAECESQLGEHEASLKQWEDVIYSEPYNARARAGYVRELAFLERNEQLTDAIADLYALDPLDEIVTERHQEALLRTIRRGDPSIRVWHPQWHPGDFTAAGETAREVASRLQLTSEREPIPEDVRPYTDESMADRLVAEIGILAKEGSEEAEPGGEGETAETGEELAAEAPAAEGAESEEERALASLFDEEGAPETGEAEAVAEQGEEAAAGEVEEAEAETPAEGAEIQEEEQLPAEESAEEPAEESEEDAQAPEPITAEEAEAAPPPPDKLAEAIAAAEVDPEGVFDMEQLIQQIEEKEPYIVEEPVVKIEELTVENGPVEVRTGGKPTEKAEKAPKAVAAGKPPEAAAAPVAKGEVEAAAAEEEPEQAATAAATATEPAAAEAEAKQAAGGKLSQAELDELVAAEKEAAGTPSEPEAVAAEEPSPTEHPMTEEKAAAEPALEESTAGTEAEIAPIPADEGEKAQPEEFEAPAETKAGRSPEEIEQAAEDILDVRTAKTREDFVTQKELDDILAGRTKPPAPEYMSEPAKESATEESEEAPVAAEELEGELDQPFLDKLYGEQAEEQPAEKEEEGPEGEITQEMLDELYSEPVEEGEKDKDVTLTQDDLDRVFHDTSELEEAFGKTGLELDEAGSHAIQGTPTLEEMKKRLDELELRAERGTLHPPSQPDEEEYELAGHTDLDHILGAKEPEPPQAPPEEPAASAEPADLEAAAPGVEEKPAEALEAPSPPSPKKPSEGLSAADFVEAVRTAPPMPRIGRPQPHRAHVEEPEIPPEEFNGPVTKTFAKLCLAQGKVDHASYVLSKLMAKDPSDPDLARLQAEINKKAP